MEYNNSESINNNNENKFRDSMETLCPGDFGSLSSSEKNIFSFSCNKNNSFSFGSDVSEKLSIIFSGSDDDIDQFERIRNVGKGKSTN